MEGLSDTGEKVKAVFFFFFNPPRVRVEGNGNPLQYRKTGNEMSFYAAVLQGEVIDTGILL